MPPTCDAYVWVDSSNRADVLRQFVGESVDETDPGDPRFDAFFRTYVDEKPREGDLDAMAELRESGATERDQPFALYLRSTRYYGVTIALTVEGSLVLGLSLDDPSNDPTVWMQARNEIERMAARLGGTKIVGGVELPPPTSRAAWDDDSQVAFRSDSIAR